LGLSALALKADLVEQLIDRRDPRTAGEIQLMSRICAATRADIRQVTAGQRQLTLEEEVAAASELLSSAGLAVQVTMPDPTPGAAINDVLVPILRESVTNILRHSAASQCSIEVGVLVDKVRLVVCNNGVMGGIDGVGWNGDRSFAATGTGQGLVNLTDRVQAVGGDLVTEQLDNQFELTADVPMPLSKE
jgi:two-component system, NarL family, sensor histidine kinase DesK